MDVNKQIARAIIYVYKHDNPFYAHLMSGIHRIVSNDVPTAAVGMSGSSINMYINEEFFTKTHVKRAKTEDDIIKMQSGLILHELRHVLYLHINEGVHKYDNHKIANIAMDMVVNEGICKLRMPGDLYIFADEFGLPKGKTTKFYYDELLKIAKAENYNTVDDHSYFGKGDEVSDAQKQILNDIIKQAANKTDAKDIGNLPREIKKLIEELQKPEKLPWGLLLRRFVARSTNSDIRWTKRKISKRFGTRPAQKLKTRLSILVTTDVSGSVSDEEYVEFFREIKGIAKYADVDVLQWDAKAYPIEKFKKFNTKNIRKGAGGTDPTCMLEQIENKQYDAMISFTDGHLFRTWDVRLKFPQLWVITSGGTQEYVKNFNNIKM